MTQQKLKPGTVRRIIGYAKPYKLWLALFLFATVLDSLITVVNPVLLGDIIDKGILPRDEAVVIGLAIAVAAVALFDAFLGFTIRWFSARIGEGLIYDLRTQVFSHVQQQPIAFFTRAQTGSLVSRLNSDVIGAQQAITSTMSSVVSNILTTGVILVDDVLQVLADQPHRAGADPPVPASRPRGSAAGCSGSPANRCSLTPRWARR